MTDWVEDIKYYAIKDLFDSDGIFTVVCSDYLYTNVVNAASARNLLPWDKMRIPFIYCVNQKPSITFFSALESLGAQLNLHLYSVPPSGSAIGHKFVIKDDRGIQIYVRNFTYYTPSSRFYDASRSYGQSNNYLPVGVVTYDSYNYWNVQVMICTEDMKSYKLVQVVYDSGAVTFTVLANNISYFNPSQFFANVEPIFVPSPDPYEESGGGEGALPGSETIGMPSEPALTPIDAGLFSLYSPTAAQMRNLADFLWTDFGGAGTTVEQVLGEVVEALKRSVSNPLNSMLGLSIIASQGLSKGSDSSVHVGFWNTGVSMTKLTKQYFNVDCGSLSFDPVCGNTFLDYAPYSKFMIFLPYVGMRILDANDVVGHTISIKYRGDCVSGALTCYVIRDNSVIQEHTGNCALNIPLTADSWAETISGVAQLISGTVSGAAMGGSAAQAAAGAIKGAASVATNPSAFSPQVAHTGAVSGAAGHLGSQKPFILREAVRFHSTGNFNSIIGYPSYYYRKLGDCHGYTQCLEVHLSHTPCTGVELQEIEDLLKKGVII